VTVGFEPMFQEPFSHGRRSQKPRSSCSQASLHIKKPNIPTIEPFEDTFMLRFLLATCLTLIVTATYATNGEAHITNTNTPVIDSDIQTALSNGISAGFANSFPGRQYGISVLLDTQSLPQLPGELVYMALGLSHRLPNGALELPVGRFSDVLVLTPDSTPEARKEAIIQKLGAVAASFSRAMIQNKTVFDHAKSSAPAIPGHWSEWPDYHPSTAGKVGGSQ
jgi:hypothetical protein